MQVIELPKKLFVSAEEKGSVIKDIYEKVIDYNTCYWNCLESFMKETRQDMITSISEYKNKTTTNLPFNEIFIKTKDNPNKKGSCADHRVILKTSTLFDLDIYILTSGTHIYKFGNYNSEPLCLFLHRNHFKIINDATSKLQMIEISKNPYLVLDIIPKLNGKHRKRGKR